MKKLWVSLLFVTVMIVILQAGFVKALDRQSDLFRIVDVKVSPREVVPEGNMTLTVKVKNVSQSQLIYPFWKGAVHVYGENSTLATHNEPANQNGMRPLETKTFTLTFPFPKRVHRDTGEYKPQIFLELTASCVDNPYWDKTWLQFDYNCKTVGRIQKCKYVFQKRLLKQPQPKTSLPLPR